MTAATDYVEPARIRGAWLGRISGCLLGKAVERFTLAVGNDGLREYLASAGALPLRDYIPLAEHPEGHHLLKTCTRGNLVRAEADDDIDYTVLALRLMERFGPGLTTLDVGRSWLTWLPAAVTWTAEREAYRTLLELAGNEIEFFTDDTHPPDLSPCSDNDFNELIGAQLRSELYGWVNPGDPTSAARLARVDAALTHRGDAVEAAAYFAALAALIPVSRSLAEAVESSLDYIVPTSGTASAVQLATDVAAHDDAVARLHDAFADYHPVASSNNLALVVCGLLRGEHDFATAIGDTVAGGWDTDCNGATVGGMWGLTGRPIPASWTRPWQGRVVVRVSGFGENSLEDIIDRTVQVARAIQANTNDANTNT